VVIFPPAITTSFIDIGIVKFKLNISHCSRILSLITGILIVALLAPARNVALIGVES